MTESELFSADDRRALQEAADFFCNGRFNAEQLEAVQVALFGVPELPESLRPKEKLLAWQKTLAVARERLAVRGLAEVADAVLARLDWKNSVRDCRTAYETLKTEALRASAGQPTSEAVRAALAALARAGCVSEHDSAALAAYLLDLSTATPPQQLPPAFLARLIEVCRDMPPGEWSACLTESRRQFRVLP